MPRRKNQGKMKLYLAAAAKVSKKKKKNTKTRLGAYLIQELIQPSCKPNHTPLKNISHIYYLGKRGPLHMEQNETQFMSEFAEY
jgi:hypothetical protein